MINYRFFEKWRLHHVRAEAECSLLALVEYGMELGRSAGPQADLDLPAVFDLRATELDTDSTQDIKKAIALRKSLKAGTGNNPCAYVVGSRWSFGIMRMYGIYAELEGLRREEMTLITEDMDEAATWIIGHLDLSPEDQAEVRKTLHAGAPAGV